MLRNADVVVWLDLPVRIWLPRLVRRTFGRLIRREELWNGNRETVRSVIFGRDSLLWYALRNHPRHRRVYPERLAAYNVVRLRSPREVERWLENASQVTDCYLAFGGASATLPPRPARAGRARSASAARRRRRRRRRGSTTRAPTATSGREA